MTEPMQQPILEIVAPLLERSQTDNRPVVLMTCGIAGSGKTTLAKGIVGELPHFVRLSIDEIIFEKHGIYGVDYPADDKLYDQHQQEAEEIYIRALNGLLTEKKSIVLDKSFYAKQDRDEFKKMIEDGGARWVLVYLKAGDKEKLWKRICDRSAKEKEANSALDITREVFEGYWTGFESPNGEGETTIDGFLHDIEGRRAA